MEHYKFVVSKYGRVYRVSTAPGDVPVDRAAIAGAVVGSFLYGELLGRILLGSRDAGENV